MLTPTRSRTRVPRALTALGITAVMGLVVAACGDSTTSSGAPEMDRGSMTTPSSAPTGSDHGMPGMGAMPTGDGLAADSDGFHFAALTSSFPAGQPSSFQFRITGAAGNPVTVFKPDQTKLMHFYLIRSDLTGFQHVHPSRSADGTWTAPLAAARPGTYRAYASFITKDASGHAVPETKLQVTTRGFR
jgi:hypothetical protein